MLSPITITKQSPFLGEECVLCKNPFAPGDEIVICPEDSSRHHTHCWRANGSKCAAYGCRGRGEIETPNAPEPETPAPQNNPSTNQPPVANANGRIQQTARRFGCGQGCLLVGIAIAIIFFSIGCFGLWAIADYIMLEVLGWQYRVPETGLILPQIALLFLS
jgi:hypothetical protein